MKAIITALSLLIFSVCIVGAEDTLESGFNNPPAQAKPHTYWFWMNGNITREGITLDLEEMNRAGIGGVLIMNIAGPHYNCDTPAGPVDYLSPEFLDMVSHASREAQRLGLEINFHNCAGWATSGGPWVTPELAMQRLTSAEVQIWGNQSVKMILPHPEFWEGYYRDIAVFAIPASMDTKRSISKWQSKAGQRAGRNDRQPELQSNGKIPAIPVESIIDLSRHVNPDGILEWNAPAGKWKIIRLGHTPTGMTNMPAAASGTGLEIDKLRRDSLDLHWKKGIQPVLDHLGPLAGKGKAFNTLHIDSYEAGLHEWTPRMREEFKKRRGYNSTPYLLALTGRVIESADATERFYWDFRRTIADLFADNYYGYFADLCHDRGMRFSVEPYTSCFEGLAVSAKADLPIAEFWAMGVIPFP